MKKRIVLQGALSVGALLAMLACPALLLNDFQRESWDNVFDVLGMMFIVCGFLLRMTARGYKADHSAQGHRLVCDGPYGIVRNPMYLGVFLIGIGVAAVLLRIGGLLIFLAVYAAISTRQMRREEAVLVDSFGADYRAYCRRVPKLIPRRVRVPELLQLLIPRRGWVGRELCSFVTVLSAVIAVATWRDMQLFGYKAVVLEPLKNVSVVFSCLAALWVVAVWFKAAPIQRMRRFVAGTVFCLVIGYWGIGIQSLEAQVVAMMNPEHGVSPAASDVEE